MTNRITLCSLFAAGVLTAQEAPSPLPPGGSAPYVHQ
jgi:hypothetical protein